MNKKIVNEINERILDALDQQIIPWKQPWKNGIMNQNAISGHAYSGINLSMIEHISPIEWENIILYGEYILNRSLIHK